MLLHEAQLLGERRLVRLLDHLLRLGREDRFLVDVGSDLRHGLHLILLRVLWAKILHQPSQQCLLVLARIYAH